MVIVLCNLWAYIYDVWHVHESWIEIYARVGFMDPFIWKIRCKHSDDAGDDDDDDEYMCAE